MSCLTCLSCLSVLSVGNVGVLWPNGRTDQDAAWYGGRPWPQAILCWLGTQPATESGPHSTPTFWPITIVAKRLDGSGYHLVGGSPRPRRHCVRWGPNSRHGKGHTSPPTFRPTSVVAKRSPISATAELLFCPVTHNYKVSSYHNTTHAMPHR